jgi:hypothetical protein
MRYGIDSIVPKVIVGEIDQSVNSFHQSGYNRLNHLNLGNK